jgi:hypothetical protein
MKPVRHKIKAADRLNSMVKIPYKSIAGTAASVPVLEPMAVFEFMTVHLRVIMVIHYSHCRSNYGMCSKKRIHE